MSLYINLSTTDEYGADNLVRVRITPIVFVSESCFDFLGYQFLLCQSVSK